LARRSKKWIANRILDIVRESSHAVIEGGLAHPGHLPLTLDIRFNTGQRRSFDLYFWTVSHGGASRSEGEFRIQITFPRHGQTIRRDRGTVLLLGYHGPMAAVTDDPTASLGTPGSGDVFVAWDPLMHLRVGKSVSVQVPGEVLREAQVRGVYAHFRKCVAGVETVVAMRSARLPAYLRLASAGHSSVSPEELLITVE